MRLRSGDLVAWSWSFGLLSSLLVQEQRLSRVDTTVATALGAVDPFPFSSCYTPFSSSTRLAFWEQSRSSVVFWGRKSNAIRRNLYAAANAARWSLVMLSNRPPLGRFHGTGLS